VDFETKIFETLEYIVSLAFEVTLKGELRKNCLYLDDPDKRNFTFSCFTYSGSRRGIAATCNLTECQVRFNHQENTHG